MWAWSMAGAAALDPAHARSPAGLVAREARWRPNSAALGDGDVRGDRRTRAGGRHPRESRGDPPAGAGRCAKGSRRPARRLADRLRRSGVVTFEDLLVATEGLLASAPRVRHELRRRIDQLMVDEFQDTDDTQCRIVSLARPRRQPRASRPGLFIVGDPKQSIYGWRRADLAAYDAFKARVAERRWPGPAAGVQLPLGAPDSRRGRAPGEAGHGTRRSASSRRSSRSRRPTRRTDDPGFATGRWSAVEHWLAWPTDATTGEVVTWTRTSADAAVVEAANLAADIRRLHDEAGVAWGDDRACCCGPPPPRRWCSTASAGGRPVRGRARARVLPPARGGRGGGAGALCPRTGRPDRAADRAALGRRRRPRRRPRAALGIRSAGGCRRPAGGRCPDHGGGRLLPCSRRGRGADRPARVSRAAWVADRGARRRRDDRGAARVGPPRPPRSLRRAAADAVAGGGDRVGALPRPVPPRAPRAVLRRAGGRARDRRTAACHRWRDSSGERSSRAATASSPPHPMWRPTRSTS